MVKLLFYAYCAGIPSSRRIERDTYEVIPFRILSTDQHPDHDTIAEFRKRHLAALSIRYGLPSPAAAKLSVYSAAGTQVRTATTGRQDPGWYTAAWDGNDSRGRRVGTGAYLVRLEAGLHVHPQAGRPALARFSDSHGRSLRPARGFQPSVSERNH